MLLARASRGFRFRRTSISPCRLLLGMAVCTLAAQAISAQSSLSTIKGAVNQQVRHARQIAPELGVHIVELDSGDDIYSFNADTRRIIASNTKLMSTATALDRLGPGYFTETPFFIRGAAEGSILKGDVGVVGGGDPNISGRHHNGDSFAVFRQWAQRLKALGLTTVSGDLYLATGLFDDQWVHPDWPKDQLDRWYQAPVASLSFNDNCVLVKVEPIRTGDGHARVGWVPEVPLFQVDGRVSITSNQRRQWIRISRETLGATLEEQRRFKVSGSIYKRTEQVDKWVTVPNPITYFGVALRQAFRDEGVYIRGRVLKVDRLSGTWKRAAVHRTDLLTSLEVINKRSQNFYAESITKLLGAELCGDGTWAGGLRAIQEFLDEVGLPRDQYQMADGSGMSRNNQFTPSQITTLLRFMYFHQWGQEFVRTLPFSGETDLSWEKRLAKAPYKGNVLAKTGTLSGVSTLSGYAKGRSGKLYAFSILCNRSKANWRAKDAQDRILRALIDHG